MTLLFLALLQVAPLPPADTSLRLWYREPAAVWNEALPIGNGRLGAMVFGGIANETIQLNEETLWSGGPHTTRSFPARTRHSAKFSS